MRTLHIITSLATGGAQKVLYDLLSGGLATSGKVAVLSLRGEGMYGPLIRDLGVPVYALGMTRGLPGPKLLGQLKAIMNEFQPEIVQGWMYHGNLAASFGSWTMPNLRPRVAWSIHHTLYAIKNEKPLTRQIIRANRLLSTYTDRIVYCSRLSKELHEKFGFDPEPGQVIPNGFDTSLLRPDEAQGRATRDALGISQHSTIIGHVARFHPMKDHACFLRAAVAVIRKRPHVVALLVGANVSLDAPELAGIVPPELAHRFYFLGERDDVPALIQAMDVHCQSSWSEAFPLVLGEAMALAVPCVATDVGDSRDIIGDTGQVIPPSDEEALALALTTMVDHPPSERAFLGNSARERIEERYSLPQVVDQYLQLYEQLVV